MGESADRSQKARERRPCKLRIFAAKLASVWLPGKLSKAKENEAFSASYLLFGFMF